MKKQKEKEVMWEGKKLHTNKPFTPSLEGVGGAWPLGFIKNPLLPLAVYIYIYIYIYIYSYCPLEKKNFLTLPLCSSFITVFFSRDLSSCSVLFFFLRNSSCSVLNSINKWWFHWKKKKKNQIMWLVSVQGWNVGDILPNPMRGHCNFPIKKNVTGF